MLPLTGFQQSVCDRVELFGDPVLSQVQPVVVVVVVVVVVGL
ncbi:hypothetical protein [Pseudomonas arcuscaelestis]|nr:hypothetical protein [Pseudomonas arcuscaelestis]